MFRYVVDDEDDKRTNGSAASDGGKTTMSSLLQERTGTTHYNQIGTCSGGTELKEEDGRTRMTTIMTIAK